MEEEAFLSIEKTAEAEGLQMAYKELLRHLEVLQRSSFQAPVHMANRYCRIQEEDKAMAQVNLGFEFHTQNMPYIYSGFNKLEILYENPLFLSITEQLNLPKRVID